MINVGIIGCGFVGGALKDWLEHNNPECKLFISDPPKGYNAIYFILHSWYLIYKS